MIVRTDAVVLRSFDYGETSKIVRLLTRQHGVIGVLARGARRPKSTFGSSLQPTSYVQVVYYHRPQRGLQTLKEAAHVERFKRLTGDLGRVTGAMRAVEVARVLLDEGEAHPLALDLLVRTLQFIDAADENVGNAAPWFQLRLAALLGFAPDVQREDVEALGESGGRLLVRSGAIVADGSNTSAGGFMSSGEGVKAGRAALRAFAVLARTGLDVAGRMRLTTEVLHELEGLVDAFVRTHTEATHPERVRTVAGQIESRLRALADDLEKGEAGAV